MLKHSFTNVAPAEDTHDAAGTDPLLAKAEESDDEPTRYSSPPCYLAEFSDADTADGTAK